MRDPRDRHTRRPAPEDEDELREEDVTRGDLLDDRVEEGDGLPEPDGDDAGD